VIGTPLEAFAYAYDPLGNRTALIDRLGTHTYAYDALSRLTSATHPAASPLVPETFTYDAVGNRLTSHLSATHVHDAANRLLEDDTFRYTYDANGNRTSRTDKTTSALTTYTYDVENQLIRIDFPNGTFAAYRYDGLGHRIEKTVNGATTRFVYDQEDVVSVYDATGCWQESVAHGPGIDQPLAFVRDDSGDCTPADAVGFREQVRTLQTDGLGSVTSLVSETSGFFRALLLKERYAYDSFGTPTITGPGPDGQMDTTDDVTLSESAYGNPYAFTGREFDPESGLYYYRARYYDPHTGTFLQEDPVRGILSLPASQHSYTYVANNPLRYIDPFGEFALTADLAILIAAAALGAAWLQAYLSAHPDTIRQLDYAIGELATGVRQSFCPVNAGAFSKREGTIPNVSEDGEKGKKLIESISQPPPLGMDPSRLVKVPPPNTPWWFKAGRFQVPSAIGTL